MTADASPIDRLTPGQTITCTVTALPRRRDQADTIERLMRRDGTVSKHLRRAQKLRARRMNTYIRGNRVWHSREKAARIARAVEGATWTFDFTPELTPDLKSVATLLDIQPAA